jgi:hypothetical protein
MPTSIPAFENFIKPDFANYLAQHSLIYKIISPELSLIYNDKYCIKLYDKAGHGFSFSANIINSYDDGIYSEGEISFYWVFEYFKLSRHSSFIDRTESSYNENIPIFIEDLKILISRLDNIKTSFWEDIGAYIKSQHASGVNTHSKA